MNVGVYPADKGGCGYYRLRWPAQALQAQDAPARILEGIDAVWQEGLSGQALFQHIIAPDVDVVVLQRPLTRELAWSVPQLQEQGCAVVIEVDDDFTCIPSENMAWRQVHPDWSPHRNWHWLMQAIRAADLVTVTTPYLAERYGRHHGRVRILPNYVPAWYLSVAGERAPRPSADPGQEGQTTSRSAGVLAGWPGSTTTHPGDLELTRGAVGRAVAATGARFRAIGGEGTCAALDIPDGMGEHVPWTKTIEEYPQAVAELDVGIAPLRDTKFSRAKSWLKPLEFAALGVAFVASPLPEYAKLAKMGAGVLADRPRAWERELRRLIEDEGWRRHVAERGRDVAASLTIEQHCGKWWAAWEDAWETHQKRSLARAFRS